MSAFWCRRSDTCWLSLWPMKASWANAMPPQMSAAPATIRTIIWRTPSELMRTLPTTVKALLCLMLRFFLGRQEGRDYIKRSSPFMVKRSSPFMGKYRPHHQVGLPHLWGSTGRRPGMGLPRLFPSLQHLFFAQVAEGLALAAHRCLGRGKSTAESLTCHAERILRVD